ncbi:hypothetical protein GCM10008967_36770 [Bacillus carboniphilus]|uniref:DUF2975 domain-containing protein n=1 Tax=Bacillus carboniphilus TaxID=86663 RepID=A0ABP3GEP8_9BACI
MMSKIVGHVDRLFIQYPETKEIRELKEEVLTNLEAKVSDLMANGLSQEEAEERAIESIVNIDYLIDNNKTVNRNSYLCEVIQVALLYVIIAWIVTMPALILGIGIIVNYTFLFGVFLLGIMYMVLRKNESSQLVTIDVQSFAHLKKVVSIIWVLAMFVITIWTFLLEFGSNLWFGRPISIDGPYQFAVLVIRYLLPFISIIVPLIFHTAFKIIPKHEVGEDDEY